MSKAFYFLFLNYPFWVCLLTLVLDYWAVHRGCSLFLQKHFWFVFSNFIAHLFFFPVAWHYALCSFLYEGWRNNERNSYSHSDQGSGGNQSIILNFCTVDSWRYAWYCVLVSKRSYLIYLISSVYTNSEKMTLFWLWIHFYCSFWRYKWDGVVLTGFVWMFVRRSINDLELFIKLNCDIGWQLML